MFIVSCSTVACADVRRLLDRLLRKNSPRMIAMPRRTPLATPTPIPVFVDVLRPGLSEDGLSLAVVAKVDVVNVLDVVHDAGDGEDTVDEAIIEVVGV